jgi:hypothetical protein
MKALIYAGKQCATGAVVVNMSWKCTVENISQKKFLKIDGYEEPPVCIHYDGRI